MKRTFIFCLVLLFSFAAHSQMIYLKAVLSGTQEVPPTGSTASGVVIVKYNTATRALQLLGDYQGLTTAASASHIHSPAPVGSNAPVLVNLNNTGGTTGTLTGVAILTPAQETDLLAGNMYVNVHNATFPAGEIRGQLTTTTSGQTEIFTARIQGAQQVPPNGSAATGSATALLDKTTGMVYVTGIFSGLSAAANAAHIHTGAVNANGPVIINFAFSAALSGTLHVESAISPADQALMLNGNTYINIHNASFGGGEIRGQLILESQLVFLKANLQGSQEVPPTGSIATGTAIVKYNTVTNLLELTGDYQGLAAAASASHIHSPAPVGVNAGVLVNLTNTGGTSGVLSGSATLTEPQEADLLGGLMYVNVHNGTFPGGEIRGQLTIATFGQAFYFTGLLSGAQEVPANASAATGTVTVLLDNLTNQVFVTGNFSGLVASATAAHIHQGAAGISGGVVVNLTATAATSGTVTGNGIVSDAFADLMIIGQAYVNIHNASFPSGEIRAQLGNLVLPVKLTYFNGYKQNNKVSLIWESAEELNLKQYEIEQQGNDRRSWISKAVVAARGGNTTTRYSYLDEPTLTSADYVLYRLKIEDLDGKFSYSPVIKINIKEAKAELSITANPVIDGLLRYTITGLPAHKKADVSIIDHSGRVMLRSTTSSLINNEVNIANLAAGMYRLIVRIDDSILQQSFIK
ncbi:MAG TPA: CHRD domain-containing protein [Chitinophagaceae bacterium]